MRGGPAEGRSERARPAEAQEYAPGRSAGSADAALPPSRPGILPTPRAATAVHAAYRVSGASEEGCPAGTAEIRPLFPPGPEAAAPPPQQPEAGAGLQAWGPPRVCAGAGRACRGGGRGERPAQSGVLRPAAALCWKLGAVARLLPPSCPPALAGRGLANPTRETSQALCFSRSTQGQGNPVCLLVGMDYWKTRRKVPCT